MLYTLTVELSSPAALTQAELRARVALALMHLADDDGPRIIVGHWHLDVPSEQGTSSKDAIRERAARAARLESAESQAAMEQRLDGAPAGGAA
jgi:hypothetical protein